MDSQLDELASVMGEVWQYVIRQAKNPNSNRKNTFLQYRTLKYLQEKQSTVNGLASHLQISMSSTTQLCQRLINTKMIKRERDQKDRRITWLEITPLGISNLNEQKQKRSQRVKKVFSKMPKADLEELLRIEKSLLKTLKAEDERN